VTASAAEARRILAGRAWCCCARYPLTPGPMVLTTMAVVSVREDVWVVGLLKERLALRAKSPTSRSLRALWCGFGSFPQRDKHLEPLKCLIDSSRE
jgi:hypothetical protein